MNLHHAAASMSRNSLLETSSISENEENGTQLKSTTTEIVNITQPLAKLAVYAFANKIVVHLNLVAVTEVYFISNFFRKSQS